MRPTTSKAIKSFVISKSIKSKPIDDDNFDDIIKTNYD